MKPPPDPSISQQTNTGSAIALPAASPPIGGLPPVPGSAMPNDPSTPAAKLTPEEQMALYEKDLKENDWGHQPC